MKLLFVPGAACGGRAWLGQTRYFTDSEAVVLPGHPEGEPCASVAGYVAWLRDYIQKQGYRDFVLAGHSMGGAVVQLYSLKYGDGVKALVLAATGAKLRIHPELLRSVEKMVSDESLWRDYLEERHRTTLPELRQLIIEERLPIGPSVLLNDLLACDKFDVMSEVHNIKLPTLIIAGVDDEMTPVKYAHYLRREIEGSHEVIVSGAGHWVPAEKPDAVNQAIASFLAGLE